MNDNRHLFLHSPLLAEQKEMLGFCNIAHLKADQTQINSERLLSLGKFVIRLMLALLPKSSIAVLI
jgi:hypothetical protein